MKDFHAEFPVITREQVRGLSNQSSITEPACLIDLLAQTLASEDTKVQGQELYLGILKSQAYRGSLDAGARLMGSLGLMPPSRIDLRAFPRYSFFWRADFSLEAPYMSRDDRVFSVTENPVRKDWVFGLPLVASTTWKGALRNACLMRAKEAVERLFGPHPERESESAEHHEGRINLFPSFFSQIDCEMINPHDRETRVGKNPIRIECVPKRAHSRLALLYVAVQRDRDSRELTVEQFRRQVATDLIAVTASVEGMMREYGFSAKKSSGYGTAADLLSGEQGLIEVNGLDAGIAMFGKFSESKSKTELLAQRIRESS